MIGIYKITNIINKKMLHRSINRYQISKILNQPTTTVYRYTSEGFDINSRKELPFKKVTEEVYKLIINKYFKEKVSIKEISESLQLSRNTIEFYVNKYKYANTEAN